MNIEREKQQFKKRDLVKLDFSFKALKSVILLPLLFGLGCTLKTPDPELSCNFVQNKDEQRVSWKSNLPVKFRVHNDVPIDAYVSIQAAVTKWNSISTKNMIQVVRWDAEGTPTSGYADGAPTLYWLEDWEDNRSSEQGRTTVVWSKDEIRDADIRINAKNFMFTYEGQDLDLFKVDLTSLLVHEFGHALGLGHNDTSKSVMYRLLAKGTSRSEVKALTDLESFGCEYGAEAVKPSVLAAAQQEEEGDSDPIETVSEDSSQGESTSASRVR